VFAMKKISRVKRWMTYWALIALFSFTTTVVNEEEPTEENA